MTAFLVIDVQNDFLPGGALAVPHGDEVIPLINRLQERFDLVIASKDWHPAGHKSFASSHPGHRVGDVIDLDGLEQVLWPDHCIQGSFGAEFPASLRTEKFAHVVYKGTHASIDSYSCFYDNGWRQSTDCESFLKDHAVKELYFAGIATDYCVKFSVLDALKLGFKVHLIQDACRAVNLNPDDADRAINEMTRAGAEICKASALLELE